MAYKDLERRMEELGKLEQLEETIATIRKRNDDDYARTLCYFLSIINDLERNGIRDFAIIGGYGVLLQIVDKLGETILPLWRGSDDLDLSVQSLSVESLLKGYYHPFKRRPSHFHSRKIDLEVTDAELQKECIIDQYLVFKEQPVPLQEYNLDDNFWRRIEYSKIFTMEVPVASKRDLLYMKLAVKTPATGLPRVQDIYDIFTLCALLEAKEAVMETWNALPPYGKAALKKVLALPECSSSKVMEEWLRLFMRPSEQYLESLRNLADKAPVF